MKSAVAIAAPAKPDLLNRAKIRPERAFMISAKDTKLDQGNIPEQKEMLHVTQQVIPIHSSEP